MNAPHNLTRGIDDGHAGGCKFSTPAVVVLNPAATPADVLALALERAHRLHQLVDVLACCSSDVVHEVCDVADLLLGPSEDVLLLIGALQRMTRPAKPEVGNDE